MSAGRYTSKNLAGGPSIRKPRRHPKPHHSRGRFRREQEEPHTTIAKAHPEEHRPGPQVLYSALLGWDMRGTGTVPPYRYHRP